MAKILGFDVPQQFMTGAVAGIFTPILVWITSFFEPLAQSVIDSIRSILTRRGMIEGTALGNKLIETLTGHFAFGLPDMLMAALGGGVLVMLGTALYNMSWSPNSIPGMKQTATSKLTLILFYASVAATLILTGFAIPAFYSIFVLLVNSFVTAWFVVNVLGGLGLAKA